MELMVFSVILIVSVIVHFFFWRDSKKRYTEYMKLADVLNEKLKQLEANDAEIDKMLDEAEKSIDRIDEGIENLRSGRFERENKPYLKN